MTEAVQKLARLRAKSGCEGALRAALIDLEAKTSIEAGALFFRFYAALDDPGDILLVESFASEAAFQAHLAQPYSRAFFAARLTASVDAVDIPAFDELFNGEFA